MIVGIWLVALLGSFAPIHAPASDSRKEFIDSWQGSRVAVTRTLYTVVYDERGKLSRVSRGKRDGLTVVTPEGVFFRFQPRGSEEQVSGRNPQEVFDKIRGIYGRAGALDVLPFKRIEPSVLTQYEPGVELVVRSVEIERDRVRLVLANEASTETTEKQIATTLTVQWLGNLSEALSERPEIERLMGQFIVTARAGDIAMR